MSYRDFKDLLVYHKAFEQGCQLFELSLSFPKEERYSLTDQIRRSSALYVQIWQKHTENEFI